MALFLVASFGLFQMATGYSHEQKLQGGNKKNKAVKCSGPTIPCPETEFRYWVTRGEMDGLRKDGEGILKSEAGKKFFKK